jgi:ubiquinone/menaquinone biosynthesis C-methylase UbiE
MPYIKIKNANLYYEDEGVGVGCGLNFEYYNAAKVDRLFALDTSEEMWAIAKKNIITNHLNAEFTQGYAEQIPWHSNTIDSIVITYTLCTIADVEASFVEMRRVLKPSGVLIFCEDGIAPDKSMQRW